MLQNQIRNYVTNLQSLRDFIEILNPLLQKEPGKILEKYKSAKIIPYIMMMKAIHSDSEIKDIGLDDIGDETLLKMFEGKVEFEVEEDKGKKRLKRIHFTGKHAVGALEFISKLGQSLERIGLLYKSSLITLMSNVEWFFSDIFHAYFASFPSAVEAEEKSLSLEDLSRFKDIKEARDYVIEKKVENIMRKSLLFWIDTLKQKTKLKMSYLEPVLEKMHEVQRRRNLLIHNNGIVNRIYLSDLSEELREGLNVGDNITVELDYLNSSIEMFELNCILIGAELWKKILPSDTVRGDQLHYVTYDNLLKKRWKIAEGLSYFCIRDSKMSQLYKKLAKLNYWLSVKRQGRWEEVVKEAESEDFSVVKLRYRLGWHALCENNDEFFKLVPEAIKIGDVTAKQLKEYPIFAEVRKDPRFKKISVRKIKAKKSTKKKKKK